MIRKNHILAAVAIILLVVTACATHKTTTSLTATNNGSQVDLKLGDEIIITLDSNPSTGYTWEAVNLDATMFKSSGEPIFTRGDSTLVGSGGTLSLTFKTLKTGNSTLTLIYHRPWETGVSPINTFTVNVIVK
jgi:inhibitor of cysteine peptidase